MNKYDYKTRTRALFAISVGFIQGYDVDLEENFFIQLKDFCDMKLKEDVVENLDSVNLLMYLRIINHRLTSMENEKTIHDLYNILDEIKTDKDLLKLYDSIKQEDIDKISNLACDFVQYLDFIYQPPSTFIPQ